LNTKEEVLKNVGNQTVDGSREKKFHGSFINFLVTNILQNIVNIVKCIQYLICKIEMFLLYIHNYLKFGVVNLLTKAASI